nr:N-acetylmuramoyl-L-alanine amidase [Bacillus cereus]
MKYTPEYIKYKKKEFVSPIAGKRVLAKVNSLLFYHSPSWEDKDVAGTVNSGERFIIDEKISVNGSPQYKVHNSKGHIYYITSNKAFVYVK